MCVGRWRGGEMEGCERIGKREGGVRGGEG